MDLLSSFGEDGEVLLDLDMDLERVRRDLKNIVACGRSAKQGEEEFCLSGIEESSCGGSCTLDICERRIISRYVTVEL